MTPGEAALFIDAHAPEPKVGKLTVEQFERLEKKRAELEAKGVKVL